MRQRIVPICITAGLTWFAHDAWSTREGRGEPARASVAAPSEGEAASDRIVRVPAGEPAAPDAQLLARVTALEAQLRAADAAREAEKRAEEVRSGRGRPAVSDADVTAAIMRAIQREPRDIPWAAKATSHIDEALASLPHLQLEDVECGREFCRAAFFRPDGEALDPHEVLRAVPLENERFTVHAPGGRMEVYFSRKDAASLETIRQQQLALRRED